MAQMFQQVQQARQAHLPQLNFQGRVSSELCRRLAEHQVTVTKGECGCGKSVALPPLAYLLDGKDAFIVVAQPSSLIVGQGAPWLASTMGDAGGVVGWTHGPGARFDGDTRILVTTYEWLINQRKDNAFMDRITTLIMDEVHVYSLERDMVALDAKMRMREGKPLRVVLLSATADDELWRSYFSLEADCFHTMVPRPGAPLHL